MDEITLAAVFTGHAVLGVVGTLTVYKILEQNWLLGWATSILIVATLTIGEWLAGEAIFVVTVNEMKLLAVTAVIGSLVGVLSTVVLTKPDLDRQDPAPEEAHNLNEIDP